MRSSRPFLIALSVVSVISSAAMAAHVDFKDPRRALGREDNIRVDAELAQDSVAANAPVTITYQIENLSQSTIAIADKISDVSFDPDSATVMLSVGTEIPPHDVPHLTIINAGEKHVFQAGGILHVMVPTEASRGIPVPRQVQIKVTVLKDVAPFARLLAERTKSSAPTPLPNDMFEPWVDASTSIFLNTLPVYWQAGRPSIGVAENSSPNE